MYIILIGLVTLIVVLFFKLSSKEEPVQFRILEINDIFIPQVKRNSRWIGFYQEPSGIAYDVSYESLNRTKTFLKDRYKIEEKDINLV